MNRDQILQYINQPGRLDQNTLAEIEELVDTFPYFQTAYLLHVKNHHNIKSLKFNDSLKSASARIGDRALLYHLIQESIIPVPVERMRAPAEIPSAPEQEAEKKLLPETETAKLQTEKITNKIPEDIPEKISLEMPEKISDKIPETIPDIKIPEKSSYTFTSWFDHLDQKVTSLQEKIPTEERRLKDNELIDAFIMSQPKLIADKTISGEQKDISESFIRSEDQLMTETLAQIYFRQGYYLKAIHIYEKLSLKFPEKSSYFATQINKIRQCIS